jgi:rubredoxin
MGTPRKCPECGTKLLRIVYGMPGPDLFDEAEQGKVLLGGCCISFNDPTWGCSHCGWTYAPPLNLTDEEKLRLEVLGYLD